ncbi:uncharacterized protein BT62DRAFT_962118 [Guyanagaster necrorhizus]|uniref:Glutamine amidotransferase type-2 domain-containing protein n=1 Tax=Guyanagaster necrorhizus TaxID=856835 RepID=A0A9P7W039_9AGAR|nr:uncharacterized protein BT62DRAFT_962118 [Guyanagaster necrorhizus MCA 3950]KAG7450298.1 hypothetical protein BT62DRAFT_962118 [Guyanagaster necrorhizus MCA 3950]
MCGIFFCVRQFQVNPPAIDTIDSYHEKLCIALRHANAARGPDAQRSHKVSFKDQSSDVGMLHLEFFASELCLRGSQPVVQPHIRNGDIFCWNGEIFEGLDMDAAENDGVKLFESSRGLKTPAQIRDLFSSVEGPYAFVFHHEESGCIIFGRDPLGRRSLLIHKPSPSHPYFILTSVTSGVDAGCSFEELSTDHIFYLNLKDFAQLEGITFEDHLKTLSRRPSQTTVFSYVQPPLVNRLVPPDTWPRLASLDEIPNYLLASVDALISHLDRSVMLRVHNVPYKSSMPTQSRVAVLFSGGIDSTVIAYLAHKHIPLEESIDLLNVAFENPRKIQMETEGNVGGISRRHRKAKNPSDDDSIRVSYMVPDRKTGLQEVDELRRLCPGRTWNFVEINVPYHESQGARPIVQALMLPSRTVMDLVSSLALALYFASRGVGHVRAYPGAESVAYTSPARVLLNGLGSDELLGGYGRHRSSFNSGGWQAVIGELQLEIQRIPVRNLGRDDRICSSHGKETRHPFLSFGVVSFLANLPVQHKMDPRLELGLGDKMLLRLAARKMGLIQASGRKKRAMQFGSHSARMEGDAKGDVLL